MRVWLVYQFFPKPAIRAAYKLDEHKLVAGVCTKPPMFLLCILYTSMNLPDPLLVECVFCRRFGPADSRALPGTRTPRLYTTYYTG